MSGTLVNPLRSSVKTPRQPLSQNVKQELSKGRNAESTMLFHLRRHTQIQTKVSGSIENSASENTDSHVLVDEHKPQSKIQDKVDSPMKRFFRGHKRTASDATSTLNHIQNSAILNKAELALEKNVKQEMLNQKQSQFGNFKNKVSTRNDEKSNCNTSSGDPHGTPLHELLREVADKLKTKSKQAAPTSANKLTSHVNIVNSNVYLSIGKGHHTSQGNAHIITSTNKTNPKDEVLASVRQKGKDSETPITQSQIFANKERQKHFPTKIQLCELNKKLESVISKYTHNPEKNLLASFVDCVATEKSKSGKKIGLNPDGHPLTVRTHIRHASTNEQSLSSQSNIKEPRQHFTMNRPNRISLRESDNRENHFEAEVSKIDNSPSKKTSLAMNTKFEESIDKIPQPKAFQSPGKESPSKVNLNNRAIRQMSVPGEGAASFEQVVKPRKTQEEALGIVKVETHEDNPVQSYLTLAMQAPNFDLNSSLLGNLTHEPEPLPEYDWDGQHEMWAALRDEYNLAMKVMGEVLPSEWLPSSRKRVYLPPMRKRGNCW